MIVKKMLEGHIRKHEKRSFAYLPIYFFTRYAVCGRRHEEEGQGGGREDGRSEEAAGGG